MHKYYLIEDLSEEKFEDSIGLLQEICPYIGLRLPSGALLGDSFEFIELCRKNIIKDRFIEIPGYGECNLDIVASFTDEIKNNIILNYSGFYSFDGDGNPFDITFAKKDFQAVLCQKIFYHQIFVFGDRGDRHIEMFVREKILSILLDG